MTDTSKLTIYPLGSGGWIPANNLETACFAFLYGTELIVLDCGTGIARLMELKFSLFKSAWSDLTHVRIYLTHYHIDHITGLFWLRGIFGDLPVTIYAPGEPIYDRGADDILNDFVRKPYFPYEFIKTSTNIQVEDLPQPDLFLPGPPKIEITIKINEKHSDPSVALRFGDLFAYVTDTPPEDSTVEFVSGVQVLLHESYLDTSQAFKDKNDSLEKHTDTRHTGSFGAGLIALRAGVERLYLVHHNPERSMQEAESDAKKISEALGVSCEAAKDLAGIRVSV